jgi:hypothetical protein
MLRIKRKRSSGIAELVKEGEGDGWLVPMKSVRHVYESVEFTSLYCRLL